MNVFRPWDLVTNIVSRGKCFEAAGGAISGLVGAGTSIAGDFISANATKGAAEAQAQATAQSMALQQKMYEESVKRMDPYYKQGLQYQEDLAGVMPGLTRRYDLAAYQASPEYANQLLAMQQARDAMEAQGAASGMYGGGTWGTEMQRRANELAQQGYGLGLQDYWGQNMNIYGMYQPLVAAGQNAAVNMAAQATNTGNALANTLMGGTAAQNQYRTLAGEQLGQAVAGIGESALQGFGAIRDSGLFGKK